jgi:hypothetical protein
MKHILTPCDTSLTSVTPKSPNSLDLLMTAEGTVGHLLVFLVGMGFSLVGTVYYT